MVYIKNSLLALTSLIVFSSATLSDGGSSTSDLCNPLSSSSCQADKALATDLSEDFSTKSSNFEIVSAESGVSYGDDGLTLTIKKRLDNPSLKSKFYIMFGRIEAHIKAGNGTGIVSSFYLQSDDLDEIDIEFLGGDDTQFQSNYFSKGDTTTYDRGEYHTIGGDSPQSAFHNYTIDWTEKECVWYLDGNAVRTLKNTSSEGYPQSPMYLMTGIWAGGDSSNEAGTVEWAGGKTDYSQAPFAMHIKDLVVSDYSTGKEYSYSDKSGDWTSIKAKDGEVNGRANKFDINGNDDSSSTRESSSSSTPSRSSSESGSSVGPSSTDSKTSKTSASSDSSNTTDKGSDNSEPASTSLEADATPASSSTKADSLKKGSSFSSGTASVREKSSKDTASGLTISSMLVGISMLMSTLF